jgi:hypothetical protein
MEPSVYSKDSLYISHIKDISFRCSQCPYIPLIQINQNKNNGFEIETLCRNKHKNNFMIESFIEKACVYNLNSVICSSHSLPNELQDMRYNAAEKFRNDSIEQVKEERNKIIEEYPEIFVNFFFHSSIIYY